MDLIVSGVNDPAYRALLAFIFNVLDDYAMLSHRPYVFPPNPLDFTQGGAASLSVDSKGYVNISFLGGTLALSGKLDLAKLEAGIVTAPNTVSNDSGTIGPGASLRWDSPAITRQKSGKIFVTGGWNGTQTAQDIVTVTLYRDYGTSGQLQLDQWDVAPGGLGGFNWAGHHHAIDTAPDGLAHTYTSIAVASGGSQLTGTADFDLFELGGPG